MVGRHERLGVGFLLLRQGLGPVARRDGGDVEAMRAVGAEPG
jgi:hypothetical protein